MGRQSGAAAAASVTTAASSVPDRRHPLAALSSGVSRELQTRTSGAPRSTQTTSPSRRVSLSGPGGRGRLEPVHRAVGRSADGRVVPMSQTRCARRQPAARHRPSAELGRRESGSHRYGAGTQHRKHAQRCTAEHTLRGKKTPCSPTPLSTGGHASNCMCRADQD